MNKFVAGVLSLVLSMLSCNSAWSQTGASALPPSSREVANLIAKGRNRLEAGDPKGALLAFEAALAKEPNNVGILYYVGNLHLQLDDVAGGLKYLQRGTELAPDNYRLHIALGQAYERFSDADKAIQEYQAVVHLAAGNPEAIEADKHARLLEGRRYIKQGDTVRATQTFADLVKDYPDDEMVLSRVGVDYLLLNRLDDAQHALEGAAALTPNNGFFHAYLADVYDRKGDYTKAIEEYERALKLLPPDARQVRPDTVRLAMLKGVGALQQRAYDGAKTYFEQILVLDPGNVAARLNLATAYHGLGDNTKTEELLKGLMRDDPNNLEVQLRLGALYYEQKRYEEAVRELVDINAKAAHTDAGQQAREFLAKIYTTDEGHKIQTRLREEPVLKLRNVLSKEPDNYDAWLKLAEIYMAQGRRDEAREAYENVVRLKPDDGEAQYTLAEIYDDGNSYVKAMGAYQHAFDLIKDPARHALIGKRLALVSAKLAFNEGKMDVAQEKFKTMVASDPQNLVAHFFLAIVYEREGKLDDAIHEYQEVIKIVPNHPAAHLSLGEIYEKLKREEDAVTEYRLVLAANAPANITNAAQRRLDLLQKDMGGFSYNLSYAMNYDSNVNLASSDPIEELRTDLSGGVNYRHKLDRRPFYWGISVNSLYRDYTSSDFDLLDLTISPYLIFSWRGLDYSATYSHNKSNGLLSSTAGSIYNMVTADVSHNFQMHALLPRLAADKQRGAAPSSWKLGVVARTYTSDDAPETSSNYYSLTGTLSQSIGNGWGWSSSYVLSKNDNTEAIGSDFAFLGNGITVQLSKAIRADWSITGAYSYSYDYYTNPDSASRFTSHRKDNLQNLSIGSSYFYSEKLRFFANLSYMLNTSNLPTGFILSPQDASTAIGIQSPSLGAYHDFSASVGLGLSF